jgi:hypothetical protein
MWVPDVLRTRHAIMRPIPGIKPVSGPLVIIHSCIRASTHRLRSYQTFSSADYHYIGIGERCLKGWQSQHPSRSHEAKALTDINNIDD